MSSIQKMLECLTVPYQQKRTQEDSLVIQFQILPDLESWTLIVESGEELILEKASSSVPDIIFTLRAETLQSITSGEMTGLTAIARENISDKTPLDFELGPNTEMSSEIMAQFLRFVQRFFNPTVPEKIVLDQSHARLVHGAWAIPMFYHLGFRSAWYQIEKGQRLNEPGDTNPFPQAFVFLSGSGNVKIGDSVEEVEYGRAYFIPPGTEHLVWNEDQEPITMIFLAWGESA